MQKQIEQERAKAEKLAAREALKNDKQLKKRQESFMREVCTTLHWIWRERGIETEKILE